MKGDEEREESTYAVYRACGARARMRAQQRAPPPRRAARTFVVDISVNST